MNETLELVVSLARRAGQIILDVYRSDFEVEQKGDEGPVTEADRAADALIVGGLREAFPEDAILSEESPDDLRRLGRSRLWLVDPLDGTAQFVRRIDEFAVMIALAVDGASTLGVVHLPIENATYAAARGLGAHSFDAAGRRSALELTPLQAPDERLGIAVSRAHYASRTRRALELAGVRRVIRSGSVGRKAALVARGDADAYVTLGSRSRHWDACACDILIEEAGGRFMDTRGERLVYNTREIRNLGGLLACRPGLERPLLDAIAEARR